MQSYSPPQQERRQGGAPPQPPPPPPSPAGAAPQRRCIGLALPIWADVVPVEGTPAGAYLRGQGAPADGACDLAFHPECPAGGRDVLPALVALLRDARTGEPWGVHRTFLRADGSGKAPIPNPKRMLGRGGVVMLDPEVTLGLGLAEGIENALSARAALHWRPMWACCAAVGIAGFPVTPGIEALTLFADHDRAGLDAADECGRRWADAGVEAETLTPPVEGTDFNDFYGRGA